eukprot:TRINITY_DN22660_c0_g1_i9.p1 TRINITY_DN22660_c0_g1~~TRINITY_DN22660_c0_g1_i9.p1  ORF type:complete len:527 (+),score=9.59 TRINITY_DN22660_c0_g1_i9:108-1688(+)
MVTFGAAPNLLALAFLGLSRAATSSDNRHTVCFVEPERISPSSFTKHLRAAALAVDSVGGWNVYILLPLETSLSSWLQEATFGMTPAQAKRLVQITRRHHAKDLVSHFSDFHKESSSSAIVVFVHYCRPPVAFGLGLDSNFVWDLVPARRAYHVAASIADLREMPLLEVPMLRRVDEIWALCGRNRKDLSCSLGKEAPDVVHMPLAGALVEPTAAPPLDRAQAEVALPLSIPTDARIFLFFNSGDWSEGWDLAVRAWLEACETERLKAWRRPPHLVLKLGFHADHDTNYDSQAVFERWASQVLGGRALPPNVHFIRRRLSDNEVMALLSRSDVVFEPHRKFYSVSITAMQMMQLGKPVLASAFNFCAACRLASSIDKSVADAPGVLVSRSFEPMSACLHDLSHALDPHELHREGIGCTLGWHEPSLEDMIQRLQELFGASDMKLRGLGQRGRLAVSDYFSQEIVGNSIRDRLTVIAKKISSSLGKLPPRLARPWVVQSASSLYRHYLRFDPNLCTQAVPMQASHVV